MNEKLYFKEYQLVFFLKKRKFTSNFNYIGVKQMKENPT